MTSFTMEHVTKSNRLCMTCSVDTIEELLERIKIAFETPGSWDKVIIERTEDD